MLEKKRDSSVLIELVDELPEFCQDYFIGRKNERALSTRIGYARDLNHFIDWMIQNHPYFNKLEKRNIKPSDFGRISAYDMDKFIEIYSDRHQIRATARVRSAISSFYKYLTDTLRAVDYNPVSGAQKIKIPEKDYVIFLTSEEQQKLINTILYGTGLTPRQQAWHKHYEKRDLAMIFLFLDTGMRVSELNGIDNGDLDLNECSVIVTRKGGKQSKIYFSDESAEYIQDYLDEKQIVTPLSCGPKEPLFVTLKGERLAIRQIQEIVPKYVNAALPEKAGTISPHKLRSSFAMEFYRVERDILALQQRMGHSSLNTTNIYAKAFESVANKTRNWRKNIDES
ncbi:MAG: tyrosine-type recombinase/integrase [Lachnospiraceae bacterium]|nr:tyrosine-type recombinase/integrase [Lachnospiraceae bacterium]